MTNMNNYKIYKYTNLINGKIYIGQTCRSIKKRAGKDGIHYQGCAHFYRAIQKYGWNNFICEIIIDQLSQDEANYWEEYYITSLKSYDYNYGYNIAFGGLNKTMPDSSRLLISQKAKVRYLDPTQNPMYGKKHNETTKNIMSEKKLGDKNPFYGKHHSIESKIKISQNNKGKTNNKKIWTYEERQEASLKFKEIAKSWSRKVHCIEDNLIFNTVTEAAQYYSISKGTLSGHLHGKQLSCKNKHFEFVS